MNGSLLKEFIVLNPDKQASIEPNDAELYVRLDRNYNDFAGHELISCHEFSEDWSMWEIHPNGDEVIVLLHGDIDVVFDQPDGEQSVHLNTPGSYAVVPKNVWHTVKVRQAARAVFITPGEGTDHKPT